MLLGIYVLIVLGYAVSTLLALLLVIGVGKGIRALYRRASSRHLAAAATAQQAEIVVPILVDLRRPAPGARGRHR